MIGSERMTYKRVKLKLLLLLLLLNVGGGVVAAEAPIPAPPAVGQTVALPMPELLKLLDQRQEWLMLPLADYQALIAAGRVPLPSDAGIPVGAWIETATITGQVIDDRRLHLRAELAVVAAAAGAVAVGCLRTPPTCWAALHSTALRP